MERHSKSIRDWWSQRLVESETNKVAGLYGQNHLGFPKMKLRSNDNLKND